MYTPYDWQEGIGNRAQFIEGRIAQGAPVFAISLDAGILIFTYRRQARKIYEIYDRLGFAAIGQQSDVEALRTAALEFCSREGYNRSDEDVTIQRVATAMSGPVKRAFADFAAAPVVARSLFAEVNATIEADLFYVLDYDGDYAVSRRTAVIAGRREAADAAKSQIEALSSSLSPEAAVEALTEIWRSVQRPADSPEDEDPAAGLLAEALLIEREDVRENRFRLLTPEA